MINGEFVNSARAEFFKRPDAFQAAFGRKASYFKSVCLTAESRRTVLITLEVGRKSN